MEDSTFWFGGMGEGDVSDVSSFGEVVAARLVPSSVVHLHPEDAVFEAMLRGWRAQMMARALAVGTIESRLSTIRRFMEFASEYPWQWQPSDVDDWSAHMRQPGGVGHSTLRAYQGHVRQFCDYLVDGRYGWGQECLDRFGSHPAQVCHEWNTVPHVLEMEARPGVRPLTRLEVQMLFDYADDRVEQAQRLGRKGWLATWRDATMFKVIYAFGLRRREVAMLETVDFQSNPQAPEFGRFGICNVRWGKSMKGSPPRRRSVLAVMSWSTQVLQEYLEQVRPHDETGVRRRYGPRSAAGRCRWTTSATGSPSTGTRWVCLPRCIRIVFGTRMSPIWSRTGTTRSLSSSRLGIPGVLRRPCTRGSVGTSRTSRFGRPWIGSPELGV